MTHDDDTIEHILLKNKPNLSRGSLKTYMASYRKVKNDSGIKMDTPEQIHENYKELLEWMMKHFTPNVRKSKIAVLVNLINDKTENEHRDEALTAFRTQMALDSAESDKRSDKQELTDTQKKNLISQNEVIRIFGELKAQATPLFKLNSLNKNQFNLLQSYVLLALYVMIPPRRSTDYTMFKIRNFDDAPQSTDNYMFNFNRSKKKPTSFVFNTYKNSNRMGRQIMEIPKTLEKIIVDWGKFNKSDFLLVNTLGKQVAPSKITLWLNTIFGKSISSSMLRHIFLSNKFGGVDLEEIQNTAKAMGQSSIKTNLRYVQKNADQVIDENEKEEKEKEK